MIGLTVAIITFNFIAFFTNKRLTKNQIVHIWTITISLQLLFDLYIDNKYHGYWYFSTDIDEWWKELPTLILLIPPVNMMFLNWYPFEKDLSKRILYIFCWLIAIFLYELLALLPEPWGYFNYGWWGVKHTILADPLLLLFILYYYKWIRKIETISAGK
ncbi:hypothetical protein [Bacillus sp. N1-1]|uniref:hypothetical protein n=1 Tax=Bacillus sp. N1-1 TaxID=2682541 RepID=UPI0013164DD1|nr:hypothetical protein [Bacillus sp. N1-1]QHA93133.1 hypothetical protein GNK04_17745 [Bacillus sp. N1-1]